jgi:hypothetical protein
MLTASDFSLQTSQDGGALYVVLDDDGAFHEMVMRPEEGLRPIPDAEPALRLSSVCVTLPIGQLTQSETT